MNLSVSLRPFHCNDDKLNHEWCGLTLDKIIYEETESCNLQDKQLMTFPTPSPFLIISCHLFIRPLSGTGSWREHMDRRAPDKPATRLTWGMVSKQVLAR